MTQSNSKITCHHIISLGKLCHMSMILNQMKWKHFSCPFDWIFTDPKMVSICLQDDFDALTDRNLMIDHSDEKNKRGHKLFHPQLFNHYDPRTTENYQYLLRTVARIRTLRTFYHGKKMTDVRPIVFAMFQVERNETDDLFRAITEYFKGTNQVLLTISYVVESTPRTPSFQWNFDSGVCRPHLTLYVSGPSKGTDFTHEKDNQNFRQALSTVIKVVQDPTFHYFTKETIKPCQGQLFWMES